MIEHRTKGDTTTVYLNGELDHNTAQQIRRELDVLAADKRIHNLVLDLSGLTFMDSSGLGMIMGRYKEISQRNGKMAVKNVSPTIDRIFSMSGIYKIIEKL